MDEIILRGLRRVIGSRQRHNRYRIRIVKNTKYKFIRLVTLL